MRPSRRSVNTAILFILLFISSPLHSILFWLSLYYTTSFILPRQYMLFHSSLCYIPMLISQTSIQSPPPTLYTPMPSHPPYWTFVILWSLFSQSENYVVFYLISTFLISSPIHLPHYTTANLWTMRQSRLCCNVTWQWTFIPFLLSGTIYPCLSFFLTNIFHSNLLSECNKPDTRMSRNIHYANTLIQTRCIFLKNQPPIIPQNAGHLSPNSASVKFKCLPKGCILPTIFST